MKRSQSPLCFFNLVKQPARERESSVYYSESGLKFYRTPDSFLFNITCLFLCTRGMSKIYLERIHDKVPLTLLDNSTFL